MKFTIGQTVTFPSTGEITEAARQSIKRGGKFILSPYKYDYKIGDKWYPERSLRRVKAKRAK
jgi:hypothetical protein